MSAYIVNNTDTNIMIEKLGLLTIPNEPYLIDDSIDHEELCDADDLKKLVISQHISIELDDNILSVSEAIRYLTIDSLLDDTINERWYIQSKLDSTIEPFTQLHIKGRPFMIDTDAGITLEEGADLIID